MSEEDQKSILRAADLLFRVTKETDVGEEVAEKISKVAAGLKLVVAAAQLRAK